MQEGNPPLRSESAPETAATLTYLQMRKAVGYIGIGLPFVLAFGLLFQGCGLEGSISSYYYTDLGSVFIGSLCAIGVFLISTKGYPQDEIPAYVAGALAIATALFPTKPNTADACRIVGNLVPPTTLEKVIGDLHYTFAALLFLTLAYFCLKLFVKTSEYKKPTPKKLQRNVVYRVCGWIILISIAAIAVANLTLSDAVLQKYSIVFCFEATAVIAFGVAWLIKGERFLKDQ